MNVTAYPASHWWKNRNGWGGWGGLGLYPDEQCYDPNRSPLLPYAVINATEMACLAQQNTFPGQQTTMPTPVARSKQTLTTNPNVATPDALASGQVSVAGTDSSGNTIYAVAATPQQTQQQDVQNLTNWAGNVTQQTCGSFLSQAFGSGCTWGQNPDCTNPLNQWFNSGCGGGLNSSTMWIIIALAAGLGVVLLTSVARSK